MKTEYAIPEMKYRLEKYIFLQLMREGILTQAQYEELRGNLIDVYKPIIGELDRGCSEGWRADLWILQRIGDPRCFVIA